MRWMCAISSVVVNDVWLAARMPVYSYYSVLLFCCFEPDFDLAQLESRHDAFRLAQPQRHPGAVASRLGSKRSPRAARAESVRAGRWWRWIDSTGVTFFSVREYNRGTGRVQYWCCTSIVVTTMWVSFLGRP